MSGGFKGERNLKYRDILRLLQIAQIGIANIKQVLTPKFKSVFFTNRSLIYGTAVAPARRVQVLKT